MTDIITLDDARSALRLPAADTSRDTDLLTTYIPAVTPIIEDVVGPIITRSVTYTADGCRHAIVLPYPITAITSIVDDGTTLVAGDDYVANLAAGIVYRGSSTAPALFATGTQSVVFTFTAGPYATIDAVPAAIKLAARITLAMLWQADQQGARPTNGGATDRSRTTTPSGFDIPARAYALLAPYAPTSKMGGFA